MSVPAAALIRMGPNAKPKRFPKSRFLTQSTFMVLDSVGDMEDIANVKKPSWVPTDWRKTLRYIRRMRAEKTAPVDPMGSERTMEENLERKVINSHS